MTRISTPDCAIHSNGIRRSWDINDLLKYRDVHIVDLTGTLLRKVRVISVFEASRLNKRYISNWQRAYHERRIKQGSHILCDDGYIAKVEHIDYINRVIVLETGRWELGKTPINQCIINTNPSFYADQLGFKINTPLSGVCETRWLKIIKDFLNTFDTAKTASLNGMRQGNISKLFTHNDRFRYLLMSQVSKYFEKSGVTPDVVLAMVHAKINEQGTPEDALKYLETYSKINPEMENKEYNTPQSVSQRNQIYLGDPGQFEDAQEVAPKQIPAGPPQQADKNIGTTVVEEDGSSNSNDIESAEQLGVYLGESPVQSPVQSQDAESIKERIKTRMNSKENAA